MTLPHASLPTASLRIAQQDVAIHVTVDGTAVDLVYVYVNGVNVGSAVTNYDEQCSTSTVSKALDISQGVRFPGVVQEEARQVKVSGTPPAVIGGTVVAQGLEQLARVARLAKSTLRVRLVQPIRLHQQVLPCRIGLQDTREDGT